MKAHNRERNFLLALVELLFALLIILSVVITTKEDKSKEDSIKLAGRYLITVRWPQNKNAYFNDDIDPFLIDPLGNRVWFKDKLGGGHAYAEMTSEDDTGMPIRFFTDVKTGEQKMSEAHEERITINVTCEGEYKLVLFCYNKRLNNQPIKVTVTLMDLKNSSQKLIEESIELLDTGEQKTIFRFSLNSIGDIVSGSFNQKDYKIEDTTK